MRMGEEKRRSEMKNKEGMETGRGSFKSFKKGLKKRMGCIAINCI